MVGVISQVDTVLRTKKQVRFFLVVKIHTHKTNTSRLQFIMQLSTFGVSHCIVDELFLYPESRAGGYNFEEQEIVDRSSC